MNWQKIRISILIFFTIVLCLQLPATLYVNEKLTFDFISIARVFQLFFALALTIASINIPTRNFLNIFLQVAILIQMIAAIKYESQNELVAYNFIAILILISAITFRENLKRWLMSNFPIHLIALSLPVVFKDNSLHSNLSLFFSNYLFGIFSLFVSVIIVAIYSAQEYFSTKLSQELKEQEQRLKEEFENIQKMKVQLEIGNIASQVAHDIRSPLSALENITMSHLVGSPDGAVARESIKRIKGIANALLNKGRSSTQNNIGTHDINKLVKITIETKNIEFPSRKINSDLTSINPKVSVDDIQIESILSNLINNSLEASDKNSEVFIKSDVAGEFAVLSIIDKGRGIDPKLLSKLGKEKISMNKKEGNGLGIYSASQIIKNGGGDFEITSQLNVGTTIIIKLPLAEKIDEKETYILLDDDELVRITWNSRAKKAGLNLLTYSTSEDLLKSLNQLPKNSIFYIDSELGFEKGEAVAKQLFDKGYLNLCMSTGHSKERFDHLNYIQKVISKTPPF